MNRDREIFSYLATVTTLALADSLCS